MYKIKESYNLNSNVKEDDNGLSLGDLIEQNRGIGCNYMVVDENKRSLNLGKTFLDSIDRSKHPMQTAIIAKDKFDINLAPKSKRVNYKHLMNR